MSNDSNSSSRPCVLHKCAQNPYVLVLALYSCNHIRGILSIFSEVPLLHLLRIFTTAWIKGLPYRLCCFENPEKLNSIVMRNLEAWGKNQAKKVNSWSVQLQCLPLQGKSAIHSHSVDSLFLTDYLLGISKTKAKQSKLCISWLTD